MIGILIDFLILLYLIFPMYYARTSRRNEIEMGEAEKYGAIAVRWTQDAQVIIITRIKLFEVEKKYIYSISYHTAK